MLLSSRRTHRTGRCRQPCSFTRHIRDAINGHAQLVAAAAAATAAAESAAAAASASVAAAEVFLAVRQDEERKEKMMRRVGRDGGLMDGEVTDNGTSPHREHGTPVSTSCIYRPMVNTSLH